jgi:hypothetical protein
VISSVNARKAVAPVPSVAWMVKVAVSAPAM